MKSRERMQRKLRTKRGRTRYRQRGASVEPVFGQMKDRQGARRFSMRDFSHPSITHTPAISQQALKRSQPDK